MNLTICKAATVMFLVSLPFAAMASKGIPLSDSDVLLILFVLFVLPALLLSNLVLSVGNVSGKRRGVQIYNSVVTALLGLLLIPLAGEWPGAAGAGFLGLVFQLLLIYLSVPKRETAYEKQEV